MIKSFILIKRPFIKNLLAQVNSGRKALLWRSAVPPDLEI